jgi:hypothetical protein
MMEELPDIHFKFVFCEKDKSNYNKLKDNLNLLNDYNCEIIETYRRLDKMWRRDEEIYDIVYLDYTGTASIQKLKEIDKFFSRMIKDMLFITNFMTSRGQPKSIDYLWELYRKSKEDTGSWKSIGFYEHIKRTISTYKYGGNEYKMRPLLFTTYGSRNSRRTTTPMQTGIYEIYEKTKVRKGNPLEVLFGKKSIDVDYGKYNHLLSVGK